MEAIVKVLNKHIDLSKVAAVTDARCAESYSAKFTVYMLSGEISFYDYPVDSPLFLSAEVDCDKAAIKEATEKRLSAVKAMQSVVDDLVAKWKEYKAQHGN